MKEIIKNILQRMRPIVEANWGTGYHMRAVGLDHPARYMLNLTDSVTHGYVMAKEWRVYSKEEFQKLSKGCGFCIEGAEIIATADYAQENNQEEGRAHVIFHHVHRAIYKACVAVIEDHHEMVAEYNDNATKEVMLLVINKAIEDNE